MVENKQDILARAYATLSSLRKNIDRMTTSLAPEIYVREFHTVLDRLEGIGIDVSEFHIPESLVKPRVMSVSLEGTSYSEEKYVDKSFILTKLDAILAYFEIITSEKPRKLGFSPPDNR